MPNTHREHPDHESLRPQAIALRRAGLSRRQIRDRLHVHNNEILNHLLDGTPLPEHPRHLDTKDNLRDKARELRKQGMTYDQIQVALGCSKSSISLWVRDLPKPPTRTREEASAIAKRGWEATLKQRETARQETKRIATGEIGDLSDRELFLIGVGLYWPEGSKSKQHSPSERLTFINSDPDMIRVYLAWLHLLGVSKERMRFRVHIHESADIEGAERFWADLVGIDASDLSRTTLKKHQPKTVRKNVGEGYRGCLTVRVLQSAELYRRIEGWWCGIVLGAERPA